LAAVPPFEITVAPETVVVVLVIRGIFAGASTTAVFCILRDALGVLRNRLEKWL
jgi:hypothetical protein